MSTPLLSVDELSVHFGSAKDPVKAVDKASFDVSRGETVVLVGESGSGKSITALSIMRLLPHAARIAGGSIGLDGTDILALPESRMRDVRG
ncbi:MAG: ATP-binding cassette domain-containing protein, partial [Gammaproteobacteria bacterium]|nr:ATP-binding cassette domain-containing protein [Gammaproteobacteria bacterium]